MNTREIKFRAWNTQYKQMHYLGNLPYLNDIDQTYINYVEFSRNNSWRFLQGKMGSTFVSILTDNKKGVLMQFIGLKDKNGKEIYEGDVVRYRNEAGKVFWHSLLGFWDIQIDQEFMSDDWAGVEVIGNIYENPELIN